MFINVPDKAVTSQNPTSFKGLTDEVTVDLNTDTNQLLYTVPAEAGNFYCTGVEYYSPSTSLTTASWSIGSVGTAYVDLIANATNTTLDGTTKFKHVTTLNGATRVGPGVSIYLKNNTKQGGAATLKIRLEGFYS